MTAPTNVDYLTAYLHDRGLCMDEARSRAADYDEQAEHERAEMDAAVAFEAFAYGCAKRFCAAVGYPLPEPAWGDVVSEWAAVEGGEGGDLW